jgi:hypothetical protein
MRANQLSACGSLQRAFVLIEGLRRIGLQATRLANATCGSIRLKLLKIGALVRVSVRRVKIAIASRHPWQRDWVIAYAALITGADTNQTAHSQLHLSLADQCVRCATVGAAPLRLLRDTEKLLQSRLKATHLMMLPESDVNSTP